jgi:hypothetical protein
MVRTGIVAMRRGSKSSIGTAAASTLAQVSADDDVSYSV